MQVQRAAVRLFLFAMVVGAANGASAEPEAETTLETVVVTGTRYAESARKVPANVSVITAQDIEDSNAKTVPDLLRNEQGIVVRDILGNGKTAQVDMRGFGETAPYNVLVMVDGRRVNEIDLSGVDWTQIPIDQIERIEIVRGTGTVLYGDNAVGGVINIITKIPTQKPTFRAAGAVGSYSRNKEEAAVSGGADKFAASLLGSYDGTDGYRSNNHLRSKDLLGKVVYDPAPFLSLNLAGSYHTDDYGLPGPLTPDQLAENRRGTAAPFDNAKNTDEYAKLGSEVDLGGYGSIISDFSYRHRYTDTRWISFSFIAESETDTWGITPRYTLERKLFGHANTLIAGVDVYLAEMNIDNFNGPPRTPSGLADIDRNSYGAYFNDEFSILDNLILTLGARREKVEYDLKQKDLTGFFAPLQENVSDWENAYTAGLTYLYGKKSSLFARYNRSFRFPLTDELVVYDFLNARIEVNSNLSPQTGDHYEIGIKHFFTPELQGNLALFRSEIDNEIFFNSVTFTNENYPHTLHEGVELGLSADLFKVLTLFGNYAYEKATFQDGPFDGNDIPAVPRNRASAGFRLYDIWPGLVFTGAYNYVGPSYAISDIENALGKVGSWYTIDLRATYDWKWLRAFAGVNNVTNQEYSSYIVASGGVLNYYPAPERNWVTGVEIKF